MVAQAVHMIARFREARINEESLFVLSSQWLLPVSLLLQAAAFYLVTAKNQSAAPSAVVE